VLASSFPVMFASALTLYSVVGWVLCIRRLTISSKMVSFGWLLCSVGCFIWFFITYRPLRQSVKICAGSFGKSLFIIVRTWCMAFNYALKIFVGMVVSLQV
jgi:hypothetical protein